MIILIKEDRNVIEHWFEVMEKANTEGHKSPEPEGGIEEKIDIHIHKKKHKRIFWFSGNTLHISLWLNKPINVLGKSLKSTFSVQWVKFM